MQIPVVEHKLPMKLKDGNYHIYPTKINMVFDQDGTTPLVDKTTGKWTSENALNLGNKPASAYVKYADDLFYTPNILMNTDWTNPINFNGIQSVTGPQNGTFIDGWRLASAYSSISLSSAGVVFHPISGKYNLLYQKFPLGTFAGKNITLACCDSNNKITCGSALFPQPGNATTVKSDSETKISLSFDARSEYDYFRIGLTDAATSNVTIKWVAAYPGVFTAETLPEYIPTNPRIDWIKLGLPLTAKNLLVNSNFVNPINYKGATSYGGNWVDCIDRWICTTANDSKVWVDNHNINMPTNGGNLFQKTNIKHADTIGKPFTLAFGTTNGLVYFAAGVVAEQTDTTVYHITARAHNAWISLYSVSNDENLYVRFCNDTEYAIPLAWAALYEGIYIAETLPEYTIPNMKDELDACGIPRNPVNLLDNSNFQVWQRGEKLENKATSDHGADRWRGNGNVKRTYEKMSNGMKITAVNSGTYMGINQRISPEKIKAGMYTLVWSFTPSVNCVDYDGNIAKAGVVTTKIKYINVTAQDVANAVNAKYWDIGNRLGIFHMADNSDIPTGFSYVVHYVALYEGAYTAETLPVYAPKQYVIELAACQRYYIPGSQKEWTIANVTQGGYMSIFIPTPVSMAATPKMITNTGGFKVYSAQGWKEIDITNFDVRMVSGGVYLTASSNNFSDLMSNNALVVHSTYLTQYTPDLSCEP